MYAQQGDVHTVIIELINRLARALMLQENLLHNLKKYGVSVLSATDGDLLKDDPTKKLVRQVLGAITKYDKTMLVLKLKASRDRIRAKTKKCKGRKSYHESNKDAYFSLPIQGYQCPRLSKIGYSDGFNFPSPQSPVVDG